METPHEDYCSKLVEFLKHFFLFLQAGDWFLFPCLVFDEVITMQIRALCVTKRTHLFRSCAVCPSMRLSVRAVGPSMRRSVRAVCPSMLSVRPCCRSVRDKFPILCFHSGSLYYIHKSKHSTNTLCSLESAALPHHERGVTHVLQVCITLSVCMLNLSGYQHLHSPCCLSVCAVCLSVFQFCLLSVHLLK